MLSDGLRRGSAVRRVRLAPGAAFYSIAALRSPRRKRISAEASLALLIATSMSFGACARHDSPTFAPVEPGSEDPARVPPALLDLDAAANDVFDDARGGEWAKASEDLPRVETPLLALEAKARRRDDDTGAYATLHETIAELRRAVEARDRARAMRAAADAALAAGEVESRIRPELSPLVAHLERWARAILIALDARDGLEIARAVERAERAWRELRPEIASRGGRSLATKTDRTLSELRAARSPDAIERLAEDLLEQTDAMNALFT